MKDQPDRSGSIRTVMVVGTAPRVAVTVARSLVRRGIRVVGVPSSSDEGRPASNAFSGYTPLPDARDDGQAFDERLERALRVTGAGMLMPCSDAALAAIARNYERLCALAEPGCPRPTVIDRVLDKAKTLAAASSLRMDVPWTLELAAGGRRVDPSGLRYPVIAKPKHHAALGGYRFRYFGDAAALAAALDDDPGFETRYLIQQFVPGTGVGVAALMQGGRAIATFVHRRIKELPAAGGVSVVSESVAAEPVLIDKATALLRALEWEGVALVEFRRDPHGADWLMEVNGRYWGSLPTAVAAGVDFPYYQWQIAAGETPAPLSTYATGVRVRWTRGAILRLRERLYEPPGPGMRPTTSAQEWRSFRADFRGGVRSALWSAADPLPAIVDVLPAISRLAGSMFRAALKALIPRQLLRARRRFGARGAMQYAWLATLRVTGLRPDGVRRPFTPRSVLFVCSGNIMRSALAAAVFTSVLRRRDIAAVDVDSVGLHAVTGTRADPRTIRAAAAAGLALDAHRAKAIDETLAARFDAVFAMDRLQELELMRRFPALGKKLYALGSCVPGLPSVEIPDPYLEGDEACERILTLVRERAAALAELVAGDINRARDSGAAAPKASTPPGVE